MKRRGFRLKKLYHLTPKRLYDEHIKEEGLILHSVSPEYAYDIPDKALFCWPAYSNEMIKDWIIFNQVKNGNKDTEYVLLQAEVPEEDIFDGADCSHTLTATPTGSHGTTEVVLHEAIPLCIVTKPIPPENIRPVLGINTFTAEVIEQ